MLKRCFQDFAKLKYKTPKTSLFDYGELTKAKLSSFVVLSTMAGFALAPGGSTLSLLWTTCGTGLCVASANAINQWIETPYDAQMQRTRNRVLVRHSLTPTRAFLFGLSSGVAGCSILACFVNPITAVMGGLNIVLYTMVYTPMKRTTIANTWAGAVVGAIPPMMGWTAVTGMLDPGAWLIGFLLYAWQFPHFNALAWNLRPDYSKAGYRMMAVTHPQLNTRVALRYALLMFPLSASCTYFGLTSLYFLGTSSCINGYMAWCAYRFWKDPNEKTARTLFFSSLVHLPVFLALMIVHKENNEQTQ